MALLSNMCLPRKLFYHATHLIIMLPILKSINKIERAFFWSSNNKITGAKCKVNWTTICRPKEFGVFGVLDLEKSAHVFVWDAFGMSGRSLEIFGWVWGIHAIRWTWNSFTLLQL